MIDGEWPDWELVVSDVGRMATTPFTPFWDVLDRVGLYFCEVAAAQYHKGIWPGWQRHTAEVERDELYIRLMLSYPEDGEIEGKPMRVSEWLASVAMGQPDEMRSNADLLERSAARLRALADAAASAKAA